MNESNQKEQFSLAFVNAIAAQAGLNNSIFSVDDDSVDLTLVGKNFTGKIRNPHLELQLKCSSQDLIKNNVIKFPLSIKNYNDLRDDNLLCPRFLVVLLIPKKSNDWASFGDNELVLRNTCYYVSLKNMPETTNKTKIVVEIPLEQKLTKEILIELMNKTSKREL